MVSRFRAALVLLCLWCAATAAWAAAPVDVGDGPGDRDLTADIELLEDPDGRLDLAGARAADGWRPAPADGLKIGFSRSAWWVRLTLVNAGDHDVVRVLRESYPLMDHVTLWTPDADGTWRHRTTGDRLPFASREIAHRDFLFVLDVPAGAQRDVYLRFASDGPMDIALSLYAPPALIAAISTEQLAYGLYFGAFGVLALYNLIIFLIVRDRTFVLYLLYVVSYGLYFSVFNGLSFQFLWPGQPAWANTSLLVLLGATLVFGLQFTREFLHTDAGAAWLERTAKALQVLAAGMTASALALPYSTLIRPLALLTVAVAVMVLVLGTMALLRGYRPARWFMLAWALLLAGVFANMMKAFGLLPHNVLTQNGLQIGSLLEMVVLSLALASRFNEMRQQSRTDALTEVFNRRHFDEQVALEFERSQRFGAPVALLVVDIDHFKRFNDRHGHDRGDEVLRGVARRLVAGVRPQDIVCRYGGEEFALILPHTDGAEAALVAEKLRAAVASDAELAGVTISVGVASPSDGGIADVRRLFHAADAALYEAKARGRNRVARFDAAGLAVVDAG